MTAFTKNCVRHLFRICGQQQRLTGASRTSNIRQYSVFGPDDVNLPPEIPEYEVLNIRLRSYDYVPLESFAKYAHRLALRLGVEASAYPVPARTAKAQSFKPASTKIQNSYDIARYERTVQVENLPSTLAPILFEVLQQNLPEGVQMTVKEPEEEEENFRYVPDVLLIELHDQVAELDRLREERRK